MVEPADVEIGGVGGGSDFTVSLLDALHFLRRVHVINLEVVGLRCGGIDDSVDGDDDLGVARDGVAARHNDDVVIDRAPHRPELRAAAVDVVHVRLLREPLPHVANEVVELSREHDPKLVTDCVVGGILEVE